MPAAQAQIERQEINHAYVTEVARKLAAAPYAAHRAEWPAFLRELTYDDYQRIRFIPEKSLWRADNLPFQAQFFHPGGAQQTPVIIHEFTATHVQPIPFVRAFFDYQDLTFGARLPGSLEYAGFRLLHPRQENGPVDEIISFLGTSYFRAVANGQRYGLSARGIAINSGGPGTEEFPEFVEFWLGKPGPRDRSVTFHGLLDGPSVTGACTFTLTPGDETVLEVQATYFFRKRVENLGLAPLTSMFWFGENSANRFGDFRGEVHDSDGLIVAPEAGLRLWRPLSNPAALRTTDFPAAAPAGFGLLQRDREYRDYADTEARYERRPGAWVEPVGPWPEGRVRLVELPTRNEYADNIVAFWSPLAAPEAGQSMNFSYRLHWTNAATFGGPAGWVTATRQTVEVEQRPKHTKFVVDFTAPEPEATRPGGGVVTVEVAAPPPVKILEQRVFRSEADGAWRAVMLLDAPGATAAVEVRARLLRDGQPISETWVDAWEP